MIESVFFAAGVVVMGSTHITGDGAVRYILLVLLGAAMGIQNAMARRLAVPDLTTTVLTLTITGIAADSNAAGGGGSKMGRRGLAVAAMFVGALVGATLLERVSRTLTVAVALIVTLLVTVVARVLSSRGGAWTKPL
jgi:uncharacterized membrane protein YoaK (UPF0700 family)